MATNMNVSIRYSSHLPVLMAVMERTKGDVLELGPGVFSTPYLHWMCERQKRNLLTIETDPMWSKFCGKYYWTDLHKHLWAEDGWNAARWAISKPWDVALVDHSPSQRRVHEIALLADVCKYVIIHDSDERKDHEYHYSTIYPMYKYRYDFTKVEPATTVLSNFIDLKDFDVYGS